MVFGGYSWLYAWGPMLREPYAYGTGDHVVLEVQFRWATYLNPYTLSSPQMIHEECKFLFYYFCLV